jgi:hypothetical protein
MNKLSLTFASTLAGIGISAKSMSSIFGAKASYDVIVLSSGSHGTM